MLKKYFNTISGVSEDSIYGSIIIVIPSFATILLCHSWVARKNAAYSPPSESIQSSGTDRSVHNPVKYKGKHA